MAESAINTSEASEESLNEIFQKGLKHYDELLSKKYTSTDAELEVSLPNNFHLKIQLNKRN
jgi:hypothetical protein